jgi:hypothetical protein
MGHSWNLPSSTKSHYNFVHHLPKKNWKPRRHKADTPADNDRPKTTVLHRLTGSKVGIALAADGELRHRRPIRKRGGANRQQS